eukprot:COSAG01_NODE_5888_length_3968_cov_3.238563_3_plen_209_part_00
MNKSEPSLQDLHDFITSQGINYRTDANGLPDASDIMKSAEPTEFEKQYAMRVPLIPGTRLPKPQYRKMSRADLEIAAATIRAFAAQGWIYKCKSPTMAPIHLVHKEAKEGIDPKSITPECPEGKCFPPRRRFTIDFSRCNACCPAAVERSTQSARRRGAPTLKSYQLGNRIIPGPGARRRRRGRRAEAVRADAARQGRGKLHKTGCVL